MVIISKVEVAEQMQNMRKKRGKKASCFNTCGHQSVSVRHTQAKTFLNLLGVHSREPAERGASFNLRVLDDFLSCGIAVHNIRYGKER